MYGSPLKCLNHSLYINSVYSGNKKYVKIFMRFSLVIDRGLFVSTKSKRRRERDRRVKTGPISGSRLYSSGMENCFYIETDFKIFK